MARPLASSKKRGRDLTYSLFLFKEPNDALCASYVLIDSTIALSRRQDNGRVKMILVRSHSSSGQVHWRTHITSKIDELMDQK